MSADDDDREPTQAEIRKLMNSVPSYRQQRASRIFQGTTRTYDRGDACRIVWNGPLLADGTIPPIPGMMGRKTERRRAIYRLKFGFVARAERVVATCGSDRCLDARHLRVIPVLKQPKPPRPSRAKVAAIATTTAS
jgi:hypothetical protein